MPISPDRSRPVPARLFVLGLLLCCSASLTAQDRPAAPPLRLPLAVDEIQLDGRLDDAAWATAPVRYLARFQNQAPLYPVELRLLRSADALLVGFRVADPDIVASQEARDAKLWETDDVVELFLVIPTMDGRFVELQVNPRGVLLDLFHREGADLEQAIAWDWEGAEVGTHVDAEAGRWEVELRLPLASVTGGEDPTDWAVQAAAMNRVRLDPQRLSREFSYWPVPAVARTDQLAGFAPLDFAAATDPVALYPGYGQIVEGKSQRWESLLPDYRGLAPYWELDSARSENQIRWRSVIIPATADDSVTVAFVGQAAIFGKATGRQSFLLSVNGKPAVTFQPYRHASTQWQGRDGVLLRYQHGAGGSKPSGLYLLQLSRDWFTPGKPVALAVQPSGDGPRTYMLLKAWTDILQPAE